MSTKGYTEGTWNGVANYKCDFCRFAAAGRHGLTRIKRHIGEHFMRRDTPEQPPAEAVLDFASTTARDEFEGLDDETQQAVARYLLDREPEGLTGYTVAEVRDAVAAVTTEEG